MKKVNDLVIHCPNCSAYFPNAAYTNFRCDRCKFYSCFGCNKYSIFLFKEYGDTSIFIKILMYIFMAIQVLFTFPLQVYIKMDLGSLAN